jgi:hypothetical protein
MNRLAPTSHRIACSLAGALLVVALLMFALDVTIALMLAPAALLALALLHGIAPGERFIERLRRRCSNGRQRPTFRGARLRLAIVVRRAGQTLASALAMRPPPHALAHLCS